MKVIAVDQGTTSTKALLMADDGEASTIGGIKHEQHHPRPGWLEHDAAELLGNVRQLLDAGAAQGATVMALANQGETVIAWDRQTGEPLAPAIVWQDQRTEDEVGRLRDAGLEKDVQAISGLPLDSYFSATKLKWLMDNIEGAQALARAGRLGIGTSDSYFIERLTGRYATDVTTAARTSLMDLGACRWDGRLCEIFGIPQDVLPEIVDDGEAFGTIKTPHGPVTLAASMVDQIAALYGHGCRIRGDGKVTLGTGAFALVVTGHERPRDLKGGALPTAAWQAGAGRTYAADGGVYTAAAAVEWLMRIGLLGSTAELADLSGPSAASAGVFFVPALAGLACPHWDRTASGLFIGLDTGTERQDMVKAVLEGIAFRVAEVMDTLGFSTSPDSKVSVDGGLARSTYFLQFLSDIGRRPLSSCGEAEVTALGAGWLALAKAGGVDTTAYRPEPPFSRTDTVPMTEVGTVTELRARFSDALRRSSGWRQA